MTARRPRRGRRGALAKDVRDTVRVGLLMAISWLPERAWDPIIRRSLALAMRNLGTRGLRKTQAAPREVLAPGARRGARERRIDAHTRGWIERLPALRMHRPGAGWRPRMRVEGAAHIDAALAGGKGAILWISEFQYHSLVAKMAIDRAGYRVSHLSRPTHGFSMSPWGRRRLNPLRTDVEDRFLRERVRLDEGQTVTAMRTLRRRLGENGIVSITVGREAVQTVEVPFFGGAMKVATGPISLAAASGAPLLPVQTLRERGGAFRVVVEPPLPLSGTGRHNDPAPTAAAYAQSLERWAAAHPGQWIGSLRRVWTPGQ